MTNLTKRAMADALKKLLQKRKLEHITVQDVADEANVSRSITIFTTFTIWWSGCCWRSAGNWPMDMRPGPGFRM